MSVSYRGNLVAPKLILVHSAQSTSDLRIGSSDVVLLEGHNITWLTHETTSLLLLPPKLAAQKDSLYDVSVALPSVVNTSPSRQ